MNRRFLITGATRGIGRALINRVIQEGDDVTFVWNKSEDESRDIIRDAENHGVNAIAHKCDLTDRNAAMLLSEKLSREANFDAVALCASIEVEPSLATDISLDEWDRHINSTLIAPAILIAAIADTVNEGGSITCLSSPNAQVCQEGMSAYASSKAGLEAFCKVLSRELGPRKIRVNTVRPGPTRTDGFFSLTDDEEVVEQLADATPLGAIADPDDIADFIYTLSGSEARWVTGECITVSGGLF